MSYRIAGIDVHKKMLAVVVANVEVEGEYQFERRPFGSNPEQLRLLSEWLLEQQVEEVVTSWAGAVQSRAARAQAGFPRRGTTGEAARLAQELTLSFVPDAEQRLWRTVMRRKYQLTRNRVQLQNRLEALLEEAHIKLSSLVSDLLGASSRRMLKALADGETSPVALAALADQRLRATPAQLCDALGACPELNAVYRRLLKMMLEELQFVEQQIR